MLFQKSKVLLKYCVKFLIIYNVWLLEHVVSARQVQAQLPII